MGGGRYPETFAYRLSPGVQGDTWTSRINGSPAFSKEVLLEGASVTTYLAGHFGESSVSMEALQEFKVQTSGLSAEHGRTGGGVFNFVMRSGQNQVHGTGLVTLRNEALNANTFLNNAAGRPRLLLDTVGIWDANDPIGGPLSPARRQVINSWLARVAHDFTISPTLYNSLVLSFNRMVNPNRSAHVADSCGALLGITGVLQDGPCPRINWGAGPAGVSFDPIGDPQDDLQTYNSWGVANSLSWSKGRHFMKFGADLRGNQLNTRPLGNRAGTFNFTAAQTGIPGVNFVGHSFASFLLGGVNNANVGVPLGLAGRTFYYAGYAQDDFKVTPTLTLQLGLRYEYQPPAIEQHDRTSDFDLTVTDPLTGMNGAVVFAGDGPGRTGRRTFVESDKTNFSPRLGAAWAITDRTSLRAGYGIFYGANVFNGFSSVPFSRGFGGTNNISNPLAHTSMFNWDSGYPDAFVAPSLDPTSWRFGGVTHWDPGAGRIPRTHQWNINVQRQLLQTLTIDIGYVGTRTSNIWVGDLAHKNQLDPQYLSFGSSLSTILRTDADAQRFGLPGLPYPAFAGGQLWQALVPFPHLARNGIGLTTFNAPLGRSRYDSLQIAVNRRYANGLTLFGNYNFSKTIQNMESALRNDNGGRPLDYYNLDLEDSLGDFDQTHTWKFAVVYELPVGHERRFGRDMPGALDAIVGGWTVSVIGNYASGTPLRFTGSAIPGWNGRANRPDLRNPDDRSLLAGFDSSKFNAAAITQGNYADHLFIAPGLIVDHAPFTLGNAGFVLDVREPYSRNEDISIQKTFRFGG
jgi:TonB dependent receptor